MIITEPRTAEATTPADPADSSSQERNVQQAGVSEWVGEKRLAGWLVDVWWFS